MSKYLDENDIRKLVLKGVRAAGSQRRYAQSIGIQPAYVNWVLNRKHPAMPRLLTALGLKRAPRLYLEDSQ